MAFWDPQVPKASSHEATWRVCKHDKKQQRFRAMSKYPGNEVCPTGNLVDQLKGTCRYNII